MKFNSLEYTSLIIKRSLLIISCLFSNLINAQNSCDNYAGESKPDIFVCFDDVAYGSSGVGLNGNSVSQYYLHSGNLNNPIDTDQYGTFVNDGSYPLNTDLFITGVVGPPDQNGFPILNDACTDIQEPGTKVVFLSKVEITSDYTCIDTDAEIDYSVIGGLPAFDGSQFTISGDVVDIVALNTTNTFISIGVAGSYSIGVSDQSSCSAFITVPYNCQPAEIVDLALTKKLGVNQQQNITAGNNVVFQIEVTNQGTVPLSNISIIDYIPAGLSLADPNWTAVGTNAVTTLQGALAPSMSIVVNITLSSLPTNLTVPLRNAAEIVQAERPNGTLVSIDVDGIFDNLENNDGTPVNDAINDANDQDDHDIEDVIVEPFESCLGVAGTMPVDTVFACFGEQVTVTESNSVLDPTKDVAIYILYDDYNDIINSINSINLSGTFSIPTNTDCRVFYISYAFGPDNGSGTPNLNHECTKILPGTPIVWLNEIIIGSSADCAEDGESYKVTYIVNGGYPACFNATYTVGGTVVNTQANPAVDINDLTVFNNNTGYTITIKDDNDCEATTNFEPVVCSDNQCSSIAGVMPSDTVFACADSSITVKEQGSALGDQIGYYYLHDEPGNTIGYIHAKNPNGEFTDQENHCQMLYVSYGIGPDNGRGEPNLAHQCARVLPGTPVIWSSPIVVDTEETCDASEGTFIFDYTINGGFADCFSKQYVLDGDVIASSAEPGSNYLNGTPFTGGSSYAFTVTDEHMCTNKVENGPIPCVKVNDCNNFPGIMLTQIMHGCAGDTLSSMERNSELSPGDVAYYVLHEGTSNELIDVIASNSDSLFVDPGHHCDTLYISYVFGPDNGNGLPDESSECYRVLKGTPVIWSAPIEIETIEDCNQQTEQFTFRYNVVGGFPDCNGNSNNYSAIGSDVAITMIRPDEIINEIKEFDDGDFYEFTILDEKGCTKSYVSEPIECKNPYPCGQSRPGRIPGTLERPCANGSVSIEALDVFIDGDDVGGFILHDGLRDEIGTILGTNTTGVFTDPGEPCNILLLNYVVGPDDGTGFPDINDDCTQFSDPLPVTWFPIVNITSTSSCDDNGDIVVNYTVSGGASGCPGGETTPFTIGGDVSATDVTAGSFTAQIPNTQSYQIIATDFFGCTYSYESEMINCDEFCGNTLGAMQFVNQIRVCAGDDASAEQENTILANNSIGKYYLHTSSNNTLGDIIDSNNEGSFPDPGADYNCDTLYISYVLGPNNGNNEIELLSDCTFVLPGIPVTWASPIKLETEAICDLITGDYSIGYNLSGGFPSCFGSASYRVSGTINETGLSPGEYSSSSAFDNSTSYELIVSDDIACETAYTSNQINCIIVDNCYNQVDYAKPEQFICFNGTADGSIFSYLIAQAYYELTYVLHDGVDTIGYAYDYQLSGQFESNASYPRNRQLYISAVISILDENGIPDFNDICTETQIPGTPVVFLDELEINPQLDCDINTGAVKITILPSGGYPQYDDDAFYKITRFNEDLTMPDELRFGIAREYQTTASTYEFVIKDDFGCEAIVGGPTDCSIGCTTAIGSQAGMAAVLCEDESITVSAEQINLADAAKLIYVLHDGLNTIGEIFHTNVSGNFINGGQYPTNTQLYISAVAGVLNADGTPNFSDQCTVGIFPGTEVTFLPSITILDNIECATEINDIKITFSISGGSGSYSITGNYQTGEENLDAGKLVLFTLPDNTAQSYTLNVTDVNNNCVTKITRPTGCGSQTGNCNNNAGNVTQFAKYLCSGESLSIQAENTSISDGYALYYILHDGINSIGEIEDFNTTGEFVNNNEQYDANKQYYISSVVTATNGSNPDISNTCLAAALPGTPVVFYEPITVSIIEEDCNALTGNYTVKYSINGGAPAYNNSLRYQLDGINTSDEIVPGLENTSIPQSNSTYQIIVVNDGDNCGTTFTKNDVNCLSECPQFNQQNITNIISPNGDGANDNWSVPNLNECYPNHRITIYNRWGNEVVAIKNCTGDCWNGGLSNKGEPLPTGAYYYTIELKGENSSRDEIVTGSITLVR